MFKLEDIKIDPGFKIEEGLIYTKSEMYAKTYIQRIQYLIFFRPTKILLYVKRDTDNIFDAIMLEDPTVNGLRQAIADKFELDPSKITKVAFIF